MLIPPESSSALLIMMRSKSVSIATVLLLDWMTVGETARFEGGTQIRCICTEDSLNLGGQAIHR